MASGFVILQDGRCLAVRHALHDAVLRSVAQHLAPTEPLREWLLQQLPRNGDTELGYAFVRPDIGHIERVLDLRGLTPENQRRFIEAARSCEPSPGEFETSENVEMCLSRLRSMLAAADRGEPPLALSDWREVAPPCMEQIGPGWDASA